MIVFQFLFSIIVVLILVSRKVNIGLAMVVGGLILGLLTGLNAMDIGKVAFTSLLDPMAVNLALTIMMITILGELMERL